MSRVFQAQSYDKVRKNVASTRFLGLSTVTLDVDVLEAALLHAASLGIETAVTHGATVVQLRSA